MFQYFLHAVFIDNLVVQKGKNRMHSEALKDGASQSMATLVLKLQFCSAASYMNELGTIHLTHGRTG